MPLRTDEPIAKGGFARAPYLGGIILQSMALLAPKLPLQLDNARAPSPGGAPLVPFLEHRGVRPAQRQCELLERNCDRRALGLDRLTGPPDSRNDARPRAFCFVGRRRSGGCRREAARAHGCRLDRLFLGAVNLLRVREAPFRLRRVIAWRCRGDGSRDHFGGHLACRLADPARERAPF